MNNYCFIIDLKEEYVQNYIDLHKDAWDEMLQALKSAGVERQMIFIYENKAIVVIETEDLDLVYQRLSKIEVSERWHKLVEKWIYSSPNIDEDGNVKSEVPSLEKVFDLNQQLKGKSIHIKTE